MVAKRGKRTGGRGAQRRQGRSALDDAGTPPRPLLRHGLTRGVGGRAAESGEDLSEVPVASQTSRGAQGERAAAVAAANAALLAEFSSPPVPGEGNPLAAETEECELLAATVSLGEMSVDRFEGGPPCAAEGASPVVSDSEEDVPEPGSAMDVDGEGTGDLSGEPGVGTIAQPGERLQRMAATRAATGITRAALEDLRVARESRKRPAAVLGDMSDLEEQVEDDERIDEIAEVKCLMGREDREDGRWYRVRWKHVKEGEHECEWVTEDAVAGAPAWKDVVDRFYDEVLPKNPDMLFVHFLDQDLGAITMSASRDFTCVYTAVGKLMELQGSEMRMTPELVADFETQERIDRVAQKGLLASQVQLLFEFLVKRGFKNRLHRNQFKGGRGGPVGLALAAKDPGIYFVGTFEAPRIGHCCILEITEEKSCFIYEGGVKIRLGQYDYAHQIRWVRRCERTDADGTVDEAGVREEDEGAGPQQETTASLVCRLLKKKKSRRKRAKKNPTVDLTGPMDQ